MSQTRYLYPDVVRVILEFMPIGNVYTIRAVNKTFMQASMNVIFETLDRNDNGHLMKAIRLYHSIMQENGYSMFDILQFINLPYNVNYDSDSKQVKKQVAAKIIFMLGKYILLGTWGPRYTYTRRITPKYKAKHTIEDRCLLYIDKITSHGYLIDTKKNTYATIRYESYALSQGGIAHCGEYYKYASEQDIRYVGQKSRHKNDYFLLSDHGVCIHATHGVTRIDKYTLVTEISHEKQKKKNTTSTEKICMPVNTDIHDAPPSDDFVEVAPDTPETVISADEYYGWIK